LKLAKIRTTAALMLMAVQVTVVVACGDAAAPASPTATAEMVATHTTLIVEPTAEPTATTQESSESWKTFTSEADGFSIDMPGVPAETSQSTTTELGEIAIHFFQIANGEAQYAVTFNDYPIEISAEDLNADQVLDDAIEGAGRGGEVESVNRIEVQGNPAVEGELNMQETTHVWYRGILVKNRLYQLIMTAPQASKADFADEAQRFNDSFTLLDE
jgi:hypothetical protein